MTDPSQPPRFPAWLAPAVVVMLGLQLLLTWLQGSLLQRQHEELRALREDIQSLAEFLEQNLWEEGAMEEDLAPARFPSARNFRIQRVTMAQPAPTEEEQAQKDLQDAKASALKAVSEAREVQSKLSLQENLRKAEENAQRGSAENAWQKWLWMALGAGMVAIAGRAWLRRRG